MTEKNWVKREVEVCVGEVIRGTKWFGVKVGGKKFVMREVKEFIWEKREDEEWLGKEEAGV